MLIRFRYHRKHNPRWTIIAVIEEVASEVWLSPATVGKILKETDSKIPSTPTIKKYCTEYQVA